MRVRDVVSSIELAAIFYVPDVSSEQDAHLLRSDLKVYMTAMATLDEKLIDLRQLAEQAASALGFAVLSVKVGQQGKYRSVEVCIFRRGEPIGLSECEAMSRALEPVLEQKEKDGQKLFSGPYLIDVVSPGIDRQLTTSHELEVFTGESVRVKTKDKIGNYGDDFVATLLGGSEKQVRLTNLHKIEAGRPAGGKTACAPAPLSASGESSEVVLELSGVFKINLYSDDLKRK
jgi:ribosome maturation factor RimP